MPTIIEAHADSVPTLLRALNVSREARGSASLSIDHTLSVIARNAVLEYVQIGTGGERRIGEDLDQHLGRLWLVFARYSASVLTVGDVKEAARLLVERASAAGFAGGAELPIFDPGMHLAGIAVERTRQGGLAVVVILGAA